MKVVIKLDPETGFNMERRESLDEWERRFPESIRLIDIEETLVERYEASRREVSAVHHEVWHHWISDLNTEISDVEQSI